MLGLSSPSGIVFVGARIEIEVGAGSVSLSLLGQGEYLCFLDEIVGGGEEERSTRGEGGGLML